MPTRESLSASGSLPAPAALRLCVSPCSLSLFAPSGSPRARWWRCCLLAVAASPELPSYSSPFALLRSLEPTPRMSHCHPCAPSRVSSALRSSLSCSRTPWPEMPRMAPGMPGWRRPRLCSGRRAPSSRRTRKWCVAHSCSRPRPSHPSSSSSASSHALCCVLLVRARVQSASACPATACRGYWRGCQCGCGCGCRPNHLGFGHYRAQNLAKSEQDYFGKYCKSMAEYMQVRPTPQHGL